MGIGLKSLKNQPPLITCLYNLCHMTIENTTWEDLWFIEEREVIAYIL